MIKAVYHDGVIHPVDPVPLDWKDGQELHVQQAVDTVISTDLRRRFETLSAQCSSSAGLW